MAQRFNYSIQTALGTHPPPPSQWGGGGPPFPVAVGDYNSTHLLPYTYHFAPPQGHYYQHQDFLSTPPQPQLQPQYYYFNNNSGGGYNTRSTYYHVQETRIGGNPIQWEDETVIFDGSVVHRRHQHTRNRNQRAVNVRRRDDNRNNNIGLSEDQITKCIRIKKNLCRDDKGEEESEVCAICLNDLYCQLENNHNGTKVNNNIVGSLECKHEYHWDCIRRWLRMKNFCPLCKAVAFHQDGDGSRN